MTIKHPLIGEFANIYYAETGETPHLDGPRALCDLSMLESDLWRSVRKSYRPLVNWGRKTMTVAQMNGANPDQTLLAEYQTFHCRVAGRVTRSQKSWDIMGDWICSGGGELLLGYIDGALVSGTMVIDEKRIGYYASGVYDRDRNQPLGHWPLWLSIVRAKERGLLTYDLGDASDNGSAKERAIAFFKRGFASSIGELSVSHSIEPEIAAREIAR